MKKEKNKHDIAIIGSGPAGVYCAIQMLHKFSENNFSDFKLTLFDKSQILRTILLTGNGRCNITNAEADIKEFVSNYPRGEKFLYSIFSKHFNYDSIDFFNSIGIETNIESDMRVFPKTNSAKTVRDTLIKELKKYKNIKFEYKNIKNKDELADFSHVIIAVGSKCGNELINSYMHTIHPFKKALCALKIKNNIYPKGVSVKVLDGDFIFTDFGISGPLVFKLSSINVDKSFPYQLIINLFSFDELYQKKKENPKKPIGKLVSDFIPKSLAKVIVKDYTLNACEVSKETLNSYTKLVLTIVSTAPQGEIVNAGGIELSELTNNCKSKLHDNLWFCGEVLNIDGFCGGFNLQNCWSSAYVVADDVVNSIIKNKIN